MPAGQARRLPQEVSLAACFRLVCRGWRIFLSLFLEDSAMFTLKVRELFGKTLGSWMMTPQRLKRSTNSRPRLEALEERIALASDVWIAPPSNQALSWDVGTNWSEGHSPAAGDTVIFANAPPGGSGSNTPCYIPAGDNLPTLGQLNVGAWSGTLTLNSNLAANGVTIAPRQNANGSNDVIINQGSNLYALQSLNWAGGSVSGSGNFEVGGGTINGSIATDKPTLGCRMDIGTSYLGTDYSGGLTFATSSQPLVVNSAADIYVNGGGSLRRTNYCELFVCMGLYVESGSVNISNPQGQTSGSPLHFTRQNYDGSGLLVIGGYVGIYGDFTSDYYGSFQGGTVEVGSGSTLTLGVNANSTPSVEEGTKFYLQGTLVPHGGFTMYTGTFGTDGSTTALVKLDSGNLLDLEGGELDITLLGTQAGASAVGKLEINGDFESNGGTIVDTVDTSSLSNLKSGLFQVDGNATLSTSTTFISQDLNPNPPANYSNNWKLMKVGGTRTGDFTYSLPPKWKSLGWTGGTLTIQENT